MNNDELKKKIVNIVEMAILEADELPFVETAEYVVDTLIAAGIGDVKDSENKAIAAGLVAQVSASTAIEKIAEWKHRAEVAERALYNACCEQNKHWCVQCDSFAECDTSNEMCIEAKKHAEELIKQAEKELAEERK